MAADDRWKPGEWASAIEAALWLTAVRVALAMLPYRMLAPWTVGVARALATPVCEGTMASDACIARAVRRAARVVRGSRCLSLAMAGLLFAARRGLQSRVQIGVRVTEDEPFGAHAWLETACGTPIGGREAAAYAPLTSLDPFTAPPAR